MRRVLERRPGNRAGAIQPVEHGLARQHSMRDELDTAHAADGRGHHAAQPKCQHPAPARRGMPPLAPGQRAELGPEGDFTGSWR